MLGLKLPTDPRWVNIVESNIDEILTDHAWCEQKAASNCISLIVGNPELTEMVDMLIKVAQEELTHFEMVHEKIKARGKILGSPRKDDYVNDLYAFMGKGSWESEKAGKREDENRSLSHFRHRTLSLVDRLLFAAMIEARSCERFRVLSENIKDEGLKKFYRDLMASEANHYTVFLGFARKYGQGIDVDARWQEWLDYEAKVIANYGRKETIHG